MMTVLLLYSYCCGIYSSRRIAKACRERVDFMSIVALDAPDFRTISDFRKRHLKAAIALSMLRRRTAVSGYATIESWFQSGASAYAAVPLIARERYARDEKAGAARIRL
jgi:hypothetical protein